MSNLFGARAAISFAFAFTLIAGCTSQLRAPDISTPISTSTPSGDGGYYGGDSPPQNFPVDPNKVPDATPRAEPRSATGNQPYTALGKRYFPLASAKGYRKRGTASWYGKKFHGRRTSSGEPYDMFAMTAAHPVLPLPTYVRVTNLDNGRAVVVKVNDRGPFLHGRIIDLSYIAAHKLGIAARGTGNVEVRAIVLDDVAETDSTVLIQVGAFKKRDGATALRQQLKRAGFPLAPNDTRGSLYRVRVGPFPGQVAAEAARVKLESLLGRAVLFVAP